MNDELLISLGEKWAEFYRTNHPKVTLEDVIKLAIEEYVQKESLAKEGNEV